MTIVKIIVTIEGENVEDELTKLRKIEELEHVISASMVYSYAEDELNELKADVEANEQLPDWLNKENIDVKDIKYNGDVNKLIR